jgi:hypothetical protein
MRRKDYFDEWLELVDKFAARQMKPLQYIDEAEAKREFEDERDHRDYAWELIAREEENQQEEEEDENS